MVKKHQDEKAPAFNPERIRFTAALTLTAVVASTGIVFLFHEFYRPDLQVLNTLLSLSVTVTVSVPICWFVTGMHQNLMRLTRQAEKAKVAAEAADVAKSDFLANMSHEIRTPMNGVLGMAELLAATNLDGRQQLFVDTINRSGAALLTIINDILDLSKIEAGRLELDPIPFDLHNAVEDVVALLTPRAHEKHLELAFRYPPNLPRTVVADAGRLRQIVTNLLGNAIKFTSEGYVYVDVDGVELDDQMRIRIAVKDTGIGVTQDKLEAIFDKFTQAETSTTREYGGTGLGLSISRKLAEAMGGSLTATSAPGEGSTFTLELKAPLSAEAAPPQISSEEMVGVPALVVDDLSVNRRIVFEQLLSWGDAPSTASSGAEALEMLREAASAGKPFQLAIIDFHMPKMDGAHLVEAMQQLADTPMPDIIVLSSDDTGAGQQRFRSLGVKAVYTKPIRTAALNDAVRAALRHDDAEQDAEVGRNGGETAAEPLPAERKRVLVAEDNEVNRLVIKNMIEPKYEAIFAFNGREAYDQFRVEDFDLVLMDLSMPIMDGYEASRAIRGFEREEGRKPTPIICLTAHAREREREASAESGMDDYLSKPIRRETIEECLEKWTSDDVRPEQAVAS